MTSYESLGDVKEKGTVFVLRSAYAFLFAATLFGLATTLFYIHAGSTSGTYLATLSAIINGVAAWHYNEIIKVRLGEAITQGSEWKIDALRHGDWIVTMPLLILKLHALVGSSSDHDTILSTVDLAAFIAALMIALGAFARLGFEEMVGFWKGDNDKDKMDGYDKVVGAGLYLGSIACLVLLLIDLFNLFSDLETPTIVYAFFLVWPAYAVVALLACLIRQFTDPTEYPRFVALAKDVSFASLDVFSKAVFGWHTCSQAFGYHILGS
jgi:hypothetical protein